MILCLDCGNSRLKWGLRHDGDWLASGALPYDEMARLAEQLPADCVPQRVIGCNVAGIERAGQIETALSSIADLTINWITAQEAQCGVVNGYEVPASLGADRWAALIGARALQHGAVLVVLAGTATTIDVLDAGGRHQGGLILPGLKLMTSALATGTAQLPLACGEYQPLPRNTHDAIISGAIQATLGAISRMYAVLPSGQEAVCLLAGGGADSLQGHLGVPSRRIDKLVLEGLVRIATEPSSNTA
ncbi:Type III pantothenate kinase [Georgfuchsia toluolica]|uniref:Type III pantothenate kinase n=1 Tax=Georgfuchsia toluolica TaxID=424218 RepID=A0A916J5G3_9PROT|nr:type III pantothenate kinase [Georgfuchsia toluolica]CAG4884564.1 Type III pantothenate kinase [Georgfuchsia toluolica]